MGWTVTGTAGAVLATITGLGPPLLVPAACVLALLDMWKFGSDAWVAVGHNRLAWMFAVILVPPVGAIAYLVWPRRRLRALSIAGNLS